MKYTSLAMSFSEQADISYLPVFRVTEIMSFGSVFTFFRGMESRDKKEIASHYKIKAPVLESWLKTLNYIRNLCAHHGRLYNKTLPIRPIIPHRKNNPEWHLPFTVANDRMFSVISLLHYMIGIIRPESDWKGRLFHLIEAYPEFSYRGMGFPANWMELEIWRD